MDAGDVAPTDASSEASSDAGTSDAIACAHPCNGACVDTAFDRNNCGACGNACTASQFCNGGVCAAHDAGCSVPYYADADHDGFGDMAGPMRGTVCSGPAPTGYSLTNDDCNDNDANVHPHAAEPCDGIDENCDGYADNEPPMTPYTDVNGLHSSGACAAVGMAHSLGGWDRVPLCMGPGIAAPTGYVALIRFECESPAYSTTSPPASYPINCWDSAGNEVDPCPH